MRYGKNFISLLLVMLLLAPVAPSQKTTSINRSYLEPDARGWIFLGVTPSASAATIGPLIWTVTCTEFMFHYYIPSATGGTPVGRFLLGAGSISTATLTNGSSLSEGVTSPTGSSSLPGIPLAVTLSNIAREGWIFVYGGSGMNKRIEVQGQNGGASVSAPPTLFRAAGIFNDLGSNLFLQEAQLTMYDTLTSTTVSTNKFTTGTVLEGWCRNDD